MRSTKVLGYFLFSLASTVRAYRGASLPSNNCFPGGGVGGGGLRSRCLSAAMKRPLQPRITAVLGKEGVAVERKMLELAGCIVPPLTSAAWKGGAGRVAVIGGSEEYTGAPYFAAMAAMMAGVDLCHVFCEKSAGTAIKTYSPELIVHPLLQVQDSGKGHEAVCKSVADWLPRLDGVLVGPGLGRDEAIIRTTAELISCAADLLMPLVLDADGLFIVTSALRAGDAKTDWQSKLLTDLRVAPVIITPNKVEFERLCKTLGMDQAGVDVYREAATIAPKIAEKLGDHTMVIVKGATDIVTDGVTSVACGPAQGACPRRCGGQGDVLAGLVLAFRTWAQQAVLEEVRMAKNVDVLEPDDRLRALMSPLHKQLQMAGSFAACTLAKRCAAAAYARKKRAMMAGDVLEEVGNQFHELFPPEEDEEEEPADWQSDWNKETML